MPSLYDVNRKLKLLSFDGVSQKRGLGHGMECRVAHRIWRNRDDDRAGKKLCKLDWRGEKPCYR